MTRIGSLLEGRSHHCHVSKRGIVAKWLQKRKFIFCDDVPIVGASGKFRAENGEWYYKQIAILRRQYHILLTASWEKIYSVLGGVAKRNQCNDVNFNIRTNHRPRKWDGNNTKYWRLPHRQNYKKIAILWGILQRPTAFSAPTIPPAKWRLIPSVQKTQCFPVLAERPLIPSWTFSRLSSDEVPIWPSN